MKKFGCIASLRDNDVLCPRLFDTLKDAADYIDELANQTFAEMIEKYEDRVELCSDCSGTARVLKDKKNNATAKWSICICNIPDKDE